MRGAVLRRVGLGVLVTLVLALLALNVAAWTGGLVEEESTPQQDSVPASPAPSPDEPALARRPEQSATEQIARNRPLERAERARRDAGVSLVLTASRGDCWVEARAGSSTGDTLYAGTLTSGSSLRFNRPRIWLRLGAASNVDVQVNGRPSTVPHGTVELLLPNA